MQSNGRFFKLIQIHSTRLRWQYFNISGCFVSSFCHHHLACLMLQQAWFRNQRFLKESCYFRMDPGISVWVPSIVLSVDRRISKRNAKIPVCILGVLCGYFQCGSTPSSVNPGILVWILELQCESQHFSVHPGIWWISWYCNVDHRISEQIIEFQSES